MKTVGDRVSEFLTSYIRKTKQEMEKKNNSEDDIFLSKEYTEETTKKGILSQQRRRELAMQSSLFVKGINKKSMDTFRAWCEIQKQNGTKAPEIILSSIRQFDRRANTKKKFYLVRKCAEIYGDGFILITYLKDNIGDKFLQTELPQDAKPWDLKVLNPENLIDKKYAPNDKEEKGILYYHYLNNISGEEKLIHPKRILHYKNTELPFSEFGISKVDILINILQANSEVEISTGEILKWFSHGIVNLTKQGMTKEERKKALKLLETHPNAYAFNEKYKLDITQASAINPVEFYNFIVLSIASALNMPTQVLKGLEVGRVTGAEIGYADYYRDISDEQELVATPLLIELYTQLLEPDGRTFDYDLIWNIIYIDEMAEAELLGKRVAGAANARASKLITMKEARQMISKGQIELDEEVIPDDFPEPNPEPNGPDNGPQPPNRLVKPVKRDMEKSTE
jgi:hypothetical protein